MDPVTRTGDGLTESSDSAKPSNAVLKDCWTKDSDYKSFYQTQDDIETILDLLSLQEASTFVDVGCGNGAFAIAVARSYRNCTVWAFDALESAIAECKAKAEGLQNLHAAVAWAHSMPLADAAAERLLFRSVLHHIAQPEAVYRELHRLLKPGARLVLQAPCNGWDSSRGELLSELMMMADNSHRRFYYQPADIVQALQKAGFSASQPECWSYQFPFIDQSQARYIEQHGAADKLHLRQIEEGKWSIDGAWVRIIATKTN